MNTANALQTAVAELVARQGEPRDHPGEDELAAYCDGTLPEDEQRRWEDHLVACRECAALVVDLDAFRSGGYADERPASELERAASWKGLRARIAAGDETGSSRRGVSPWWARLAAGFAVASLGLLVWNLQLQHTANELRQPRLAGGYSEIQLGETRGPETGTTLQVNAPGEEVTALLVLPRDPTYPDYLVELGSPGSPTRWSLHGQPTVGKWGILLSLPSRGFPKGRYWVRVSGLRDGQATLISERNLTIQ